MYIFQLPQDTIDEIIRITCQFLWRGDKFFSGGHCLVQWDSLCLRRKFDGLEIIDLQVQNDAMPFRSMSL
jgi:hypothetical protein